MALLVVSRRIFVAALLVQGSASALAQTTEPMGPPAYSLMGCSHAVEWTTDYVAKVTGLTERNFIRAEQKFGFSPQRICAEDPRVIEGIVHPRKPPEKFDEPDKAIAQRLKTLVDTDGTIPDGALQNALSQRQTIVEPPPGTTAKSLEKALVEKGAGISSGSWTWLGPGNIGGRIRAISPDPATPGKILTGGVSGGLWLTTNTGVSWSVVDDFLPNLAISCLVRDPLVSTTIYACTGEGNFNLDAIRGLGIFKSTNNGVTWTQLPSTNPGTTNGTDWYYVNRLAINPTNSQIMLAATNAGLYRTTDGGTTWTKVYQAVGTGRWRRVMDVQFHPTDGSKAILGEGKHTNCLSTCVSDGAAVASSADGGVTWTRVKLDTSTISGNLGRVEVGWSKSNPSIVYAVVDQAQGKFFKSTDGGVTWTPNAPTSTPAHLGSQGWYNNAIWVAPNDPNRIIIGGIGMKMSLDGGATWTAVGNSVHVDHHAFASDPNYLSNFTIYNGNDGGFYKATNVNTTAPNSSSSPTWSVLNNNLGITQFYGGAGKAGGRIVGGSQDNGTVMWTGTTNWVRMWGSDGGDNAADQTDGNYLYGMTQYGGVVRYTQGLSSPPPANASQYICTGITDASCNFNNVSPTILFIPPMAIDPNTSTSLYLGAQSFWRSTNIKDPVNTSVAWSAIRGPKPVNPSTGFIPWISAVSVAPGNSDLVWIGYDDGSIGCTTNATAASPTWINVTMPSATNLRYTTRIRFDPSNTNRVFVAYGGYQASGPGVNLWVTTSGCLAAPVWTNIHNQIPLAPIRSVAVHPSNPAWLYAGTEVGVFTSTNSGANWSTTNDGPGTVSVEELFFLDATTLVASTHGRGMFTVQALPGTPPTITNSPPINGSVGVAYSWNYTATGSPAPTWSVTSGALPPGLTLDSVSGVLSGTPTTANNYSGNVTATNTSGTAVQAFSITIGAQLPGAPVIGTATPGNAQATVTFSPPASNGGSPILNYTVTCNPGGLGATANATSITVTGLTNNTTYSCSVRATNSAGTGPASGSVNVTPVSGVALAVLSVVSRKTHSPPATDFDLVIDKTKPIGGAVTVEPRQIGAGHKIIFTFNDTITATGTAACVDAGANPVGTVSAVAVGTTVEVTLASVPDAKRVTVSLTGVNGTFNASASMGFLLGDVNNSYTVSSSDILLVNGRLNQATSASNFKYDVNLSGAITNSDTLIVKAQSGQLLP